MSEVSNTIGINHFGMQNVGYVAPNTLQKAGLGYLKTQGVNSASLNNQYDYFTHSNVSKTAARNPIEAAVDDCLVRVAPKIYLNKYINEGLIKKAAASNPRISEILAQKGLEANVEIENVTGKIQEHFLSTYNKAKELGANLPLDEYSALLQASLLHDIGKAFIPKEILNKPSALTANEREIVDLHAEIGAEVLKSLNLSPKTVEAVRLHHTECSSPIKQNSEMAQILSVADVYSALGEERPYKKPFTNEQVRNIMQNDTRLNQDVVNNIFYSQDLSNMSNFKI